MIVVAMTDEIETVSEAIGAKLSGRLGATHLSLNGMKPDPSPATVWANRFGRIALSERVRFVGETSPMAACAVMTRTILEAAAAGNVVIRGNRATPVLRAVDHVMRVRVCAAAPGRARSGLICSALDDGATTPLVSVTKVANCACGGDHDLETGANSAHLYDIVLDANRLSVDQCVDVLCELAKSAVFQPTAETMAMLADLLRDASQSGGSWPEIGGQLSAPEVTRLDAQSDQQLSLHAKLAHAERVLYGTWPNRRAGRSLAPAALKACWD